MDASTWAAQLRRELPDGWDLADPSDPFYGLTCPHGHAIEIDGRCPDGCESPIRTRGLV